MHRQNNGRPPLALPNQLPIQIRTAQTAAADSSALAIGTPGGVAVLHLVGQSALERSAATVLAGMLTGGLPPNSDTVTAAVQLAQQLQVECRRAEQTAGETQRAQPNGDAR